MTIGNHERAQSEVMGMVLVVSITVMGITGVMFFGTQALSDAQRSSDISSAEHSYTQFDSTLSLVAHGDSTRQSVPLPNHRNTDQYVSSAGWMNISIEPEEGDGRDINQSLGGVVYESGDTKIAYQGGGVWRSDGSGSTMISPPEFHYRDDTLTLPMIAVDGDGAINDRVGFSETNETAYYPTEDTENPLTGGAVTLTINSEYYEAWGRFFEERTGGEVEYPGGERVKIQLQTKQEHPALGGVLGGFGGGGSQMPLGGYDRFTADSYDSEQNPYSEEDAEDNAQISVLGNVNFRSGGGPTDVFRIHGTLRTSGSVTPKNNDIEESIDVIEEGADVPDNIDAQPAIQNAVDQFEENVDQFEENGVSDLNDVDSEISDGTIDDETVTVTNGEYYLDETLRLQEDAELILDTSDGNIDIRVNGRTELIDSNITIEGDNRATVYTRENVVMERDVTVGDTEHDNSTQFWLYVAGDVLIGIDDGNPPTSYIDYTGVLYGPGPNSETSINHADITIKGSIATGNMAKLTGNNEVSLDLHYDEALQYEEPFEGEEVITLSYLHISVSEVTLEER